MKDNKKQFTSISNSMNKMNQKEFNEFFELAMEKLAEAIGTDPLELLK